MKHVPCSISILLSILFSAPSFAQVPLSEQKALLSGLEHRYEVKILVVERQIDSLSLEKVKTAQLPQISASAGVGYHPYDTVGSSFSSGSATSSVVTGETLSVAQQLPGGGTVGGSINLGQDFFTNPGDSSLNTSAISLSITQPLLRDAWRNNPVTYAIALAKLDNINFSLQQKKQLLTYCTDIRSRYWNHFEAAAREALYTEELSYAEKRLSFEQTRFSIGMTAPLDTLNARLSYINTLSRLHDAASDALQTREELAFYTGMSVENTIVDASRSIDCAPLPAPEKLFELVEQFDPQLDIFKNVAQRLDIVVSRTKNSMLPRVDLGLSWRHAASESLPGSSETMVSNSVVGLIASYALPVKPRKIELAQTIASMEKNDIEKTAYREELKLRLRNLNRSWERERRAIEIAAAAHAIANQTLVATREAYTAGTVDRLSLDKAENDFRSANIDLLQKQLLMKRLEIIFDEMTGATFSRFGVTVQ